MSETDVEPVIAAGGVVFQYSSIDEEPEVIMIFRNGKWDLPKGKHEPPESYEMCAAREVSEETGSSIPSIINYLGKTYHEYEREGRLFGKTTYWYSMIFTKSETDFTPQINEGINQVKWIPVSEAIEHSGYKNLEEILKKFKALKKA